MLTQERLKEVLSYNPLSGEFVWIKRRRGVRYLTVAGRPNLHGYWQVCVDQTYYYAHRLAWLYMHGYFPEAELDHIDKNRGNNAITNLREASHSCNARNCKLSTANTSGVTGVSGRPGLWRSYVCANNKQVELGYHKDFDDAVLARWRGEVEHNYPSCQTSSLAYKYLLKHGLIKGD